MGKTLVITWGMVLAVSAVAVAQQWQSVGSMNIPRRNFCMTTLNDGRVLVSGGWDQETNAIATSEIFDPATAAWRMAGDMAGSRANHTATLLPDGRVVVIGGQEGLGGDYSPPRQIDGIEIFDPSTERWSDGGNLEEPRENHTATLLPDSTILVAGGIGPYHGYGQCWIYDPRTRTTSSTGSLLRFRLEHQAELWNNNEVIVGGGRTGGSASDYLKSVEIYSIATGTWRSAPSMKQSRCMGVLTVFSDGTVLASGGRNTPTTTATGSEVYDALSNAWNATDTMKMPCSRSGNVLLPNNRQIVTGGIVDGDLSNSGTVVTTATCEWYDRAGHRWYFAPDMHGQRGEHGASFVRQTSNDSLPHEFVLVAGGTSGGTGCVASCEILDVTVPALTRYAANQGGLGISARGAASPNSLTFTLENNVGRQPIAHFTNAVPETISLDIVTSAGTSLQILPRTRFEVGTHDFAIGGTAQLPNGAYFVRIISARQMQMQKLILIQ